MPYRKLPHRQDRLRLHRLFIEIAKLFHETVYGRDANFGATIDGVFVASCVALGHAEERPLNATKVAHYLNMSRTTAFRKLEELVDMGVLERTGSYYYIAEARQPVVDVLMRANQMILAAARDLERAQGTPQDDRS